MRPASFCIKRVPSRMRANILQAKSTVKKAANESNSNECNKKQKVIETENLS